MQEKRILLFLLLTAATFMIWMRFIAPPVPDQRQNVAEKKEDDEAQEKQDDKVENEGDDADQDDQKPQDDDKPKIADDDGEEAKPPPRKPERPALLKNPRQTVKLGSADPDTGFALHVELTTEGAAVTSITLNDPRYKALDNPKRQLRLVGNSFKKNAPNTFETAVPYIDEQLEDFDRSTRDVNWTVVKNAKKQDRVTFELVSPDGTLTVRKTYRLGRLEKEQRTRRARDTVAAPYELQMTLEFENLSDKDLRSEYILQGPVGLPLENEVNASQHRQIRFGLLETDGDVDLETMPPDDVAEAAADDELEKWTSPLQFVGVDEQYFAALVVPGADQRDDRWFEYVIPQLVERGRRPEYSNISVLMASKKAKIEAGKSYAHKYTLYAGPKRTELLEGDIRAASIADYGWLGGIAKGMIWLLGVFHGWGISYGVAIILLTIVVRSCLFPLSKKQAAGAKKMKQLQPKIAELKKKYGNDKEKFAKAQMELFSKHNYNPFAGCLPIVIQMPIFFALFRALRSAVDLRMAPFLWVQNLAAPDALFDLGFHLPWPLRTNEFNLLPLLTVVLFIAQQKMFMPPPSTEQEAQQQKIMKYVMVFMGVLFYKVPAGLCVYFIASSLWGMGERKLLDLKKEPEPLPEPEEPKGPRKKGFWARMAEKIEEAAEAAKEQQQQYRDHEKASTARNGNSKGKGKKKNRRR